MRDISLYIITGLLVLSGCASTGTTPQSVEPAVVTVSDISQTPESPLRKSWRLRPRSDTHTYQSNTHITLRTQNQSIAANDTISVALRFTMKVDEAQVPALISGQIEKISISSGPRINAGNQNVDTPASFTGTATTGHVELNLVTSSPGQDPSKICTGPSESVLGDIRSGLSLIPGTLLQGQVWADTISTIACAGNGIVSQLKTIRTYKVLGERDHLGTHLLLIQRRDSTEISGQGAQKQHLIQLEGLGSFSSNIFLDLVNSLPIAIETTGELQLKINSSGQSQQFVQTINQIISLLH